MQQSMALLALPVHSALRRLAWTVLALLALTACGGADDAASHGNAGTVNQLLSEPVAGTAASVAATPASPASALEPAPPMPAALSPDGERPLLEAIARSYPFRKQIETKEQTGEVRALEAARIEANGQQANRVTGKPRQRGCRSGKVSRSRGVMSRSGPRRLRSTWPGRIG